MKTTPLLLLLFFLLLCPVLSLAQSIPRHDAIFRPSSYGYTPPPEGTALNLIRTDGQKAGQVWLEQWKNGLAINGQVDGDPPTFGTVPDEFKTAAHVNVTLSFAETVPMPEIGWTNRFGDTNCAEYEANAGDQKKDCSTWSARQVRYREQLRHLFIRKWALAPKVSAEIEASDAFTRALAFVDDRVRAGLARLQPVRILSEPAGTPVMEFQLDRGHWEFQILLPWESMPPSSSLDLAQANIVVELASGARTLASTAPNRKGDDPASFNHLKFSEPARYNITSCGYPLNGWYFPGSEKQISETFALHNEIDGYRSDPEGTSPIVVWTRYFIVPIGNDSVICGPQLRYETKGHVSVSEDKIEEMRLETFRLPDGTLLLKSGPIWGTKHPLGVGYCGACELFRISVFHLNARQEITQAFNDSILLENPEADGDIQFSPDWKTITVYRGTADFTGGKIRLDWTSRRYCLSNSADEYKECGSGAGELPPTPRQVLIPSQK